MSRCIDCLNAGLLRRCSLSSSCQFQIHGHTAASSCSYSSCTVPCCDCGSCGYAPSCSCFDTTGCVVLSLLSALRPSGGRCWLLLLTWLHLTPVGCKLFSATRRRPIDKSRIHAAVRMASCHVSIRVTQSGRRGTGALCWCIPFACTCFCCLNLGLASPSIPFFVRDVRPEFTQTTCRICKIYT